MRGCKRGPMYRSLINAASARGTFGGFPPASECFHLRNKPYLMCFPCRYETVHAGARGRHSASSLPNRCPSCRACGRGPAARRLCADGVFAKPGGKQMACLRVNAGGRFWNRHQNAGRRNHMCRGMFGSEISRCSVRSYSRGGQSGPMNYFIRPNNLPKSQTRLCT